MPFQLQLEGDGPLYLRLADAIRRAVDQGRIGPGQKLPTVRELSAELGIAGGTIRHAYGRLAREGVLEMAQGKGTFVKGPGRERAVSREKQAMDAIGALLNQLSELNFSTREMQMFFQLKLSERAPAALLAPVAVVDCNAEVLNEIADQLSRLPGIELTEYLLEDARRMPPELFARYALIVTTQTHYHEMCSLVGEPGRIVRAVLTPGQQTMIAIARIEPDAHVGIFCRSVRFAEVIRNALRLCPHLRQAAMPHLCSGSGESLEAFLSDKRWLLVSPDHLSYASEREQQALRMFTERGGQVLPYRYQIDEGSFLYIEERVQEAVHGKRRQ